MKIAIAQLNLAVGDVAGNASRILKAARKAAESGAAILVTPEMGLSGYPAEDLVLRGDFRRACAAALHDLAGALPPGLAVVVGYPRESEGKVYNAAAVLRDGGVIAVYHKQKLPNYSVFDECRTFVPGSEPCVFEHQGVRFGLNICGDLWEPGPAELAARAGAQVLLVPNASPYHAGKHAERLGVARGRALEAGIPIVYGNLLGGQDELVFDGASFVLDKAGNLTHLFPAWQENTYFLDLADGVPTGTDVTPQPEELAGIYEALVLGVRDYVRKNGFKQVHLGLSGGIDSALTLAIAVDALGAKRVHAVMMPSEFTASMSVEDARQMAELLKVHYDEIPIKLVYESLLASLADIFEGLPFDLAEENLQARARGVLLMALSNKSGSLVLTTGNKSEMAVGYATLYGDMAGGFGVLKDISKTRVYALARHRNGVSPVIPQRIIDRAPSAELRANQTDQDSLPPYDILDRIVEAYVENDKSYQEICELGIEPATVARVLRLIDRAEYKRRQAAPGVRVTPRNFGRDRRYPVTSYFRPEEVGL